MSQVRKLQITVSHGLLANPYDRQCMVQKKSIKGQKKEVQVVTWVSKHKFIVRNQNPFIFISEHQLDHSGIGQIGWALVKNVKLIDQLRCTFESD